MTAHESSAAPAAPVRRAGPDGVDELADRQDLMRLLVGELHAEALLELGHELDALHRIEAEIELEIRRPADRAAAAGARAR